MRLAGKSKWEEALKNGKNTREREDLVDDGSLQNDRALLLALGFSRDGKMLFCSKPDVVKEEAEVVVKTEEGTKKRKTARN